MQINWDQAGRLRTDDGWCLSGTKLARTGCTHWKKGTGVAKLDDAAMACPPRTVITAVKKSRTEIEYRCSMVAGLGECIPAFTAQVTVDTIPANLKKMLVKARQGHAIQSIQPEVSNGGKWVRFEFTQCQIMLPGVVQLGRSIQYPEFGSEFGVYCPRVWMTLAGPYSSNVLPSFPT